MFFWTPDIEFFHLAQKFLPKNLKNFRTKPILTQRGFQRFLFLWKFPSGNIERILKTGPKTFRCLSKKSFGFHNFFKTNVFLENVPLAHRLQFIQNCRKFPRKIRNDIAWGPNIVMVLYIFSKPCFPQIVPLSMSFSEAHVLFRAIFPLIT